jgi:hypothetical protein
VGAGLGVFAALSSGGYAFLGGTLGRIVSSWKREWDQALDEQIVIFVAAAVVILVLAVLAWRLRLWALGALAVAEAGFGAWVIAATAGFLTAGLAASLLISAALCLLGTARLRSAAPAPSSA